MAPSTTWSSAKVRGRPVRDTITPHDLRVATADRDRFPTRSYEAVRLARTAPGCHDFVVAPDPLDPDRVNVYERWNDRAALLAFRGTGPDDDLNNLIVSADINEFDVCVDCRNES